MSDSLISPLRVSNELFLVSSTIERCPKTMMLRELVMNAIEAAAEAPDGERHVRIGARTIDGHPKLTIWNSGPGMTAAELYAICDLASSLHKQNSLDANFGMGAKVASLPSNKHGLRYRSCCAGTVSEVTLGQRNGIYGRLAYSSDARERTEVRNVTELCRRDGTYGLSADWTEVVLFGNRPDQDTAAAPYDGNPVMRKTWLADTLTERFFQIPGRVALTCPAGRQADEAVLFRAPAERLARFDRVESVSTVAGITVHFCYAASLQEDPRLPTADGFRDLTGLGAIVFRNEMYGLRDGPAWITEAPACGFTFAGRHCSAFVELPDDYGVLLEAYRQFLRFRDGDQRQVLLVDFASVIRNSMPAWLRDIIASYGPPAIDYLGEVRTELQRLLEGLQITARYRGQVAPRGSEAAPKSAGASPPKPPSQPAIETPPEIIGLRDQDRIDEIGLPARAAKYSPDSHQIFMNLTYSAVSRLEHQLRVEFEAATDQQLLARMAGEIAEWAITRKVARALIYTLGKREVGWTPEELARAQSPESLSVVADDIETFMPEARRRLAAMLGLQVPEAGTTTLSPKEMQEQRILGELADAHQAVRRAADNRDTKPAPLLRRLSDIENRRGNSEEALQWAMRAVESDPTDAWSQNHLSGILLQRGDHVGAEAAARQALALQPSHAGRFLRQLGSIASASGDTASAASLLEQSIEADPADPWSRLQLSGVQMQLGNADLAEETGRIALDLSKDMPSRFLQHLSGLAQQRGDMTTAVTLADDAVAADRSNVAALAHRAELLRQAGDLVNAEADLRHAIALGGTNPSRFLRQLSGVRETGKDYEAALDLARQATAADHSDPLALLQLGNVALTMGDTAGAEQAVRRAIELGGAQGGRAWRQLSQLLLQAGRAEEAAEAARKATSLSPTDAFAHAQLANVLLRLNDTDSAAQAGQTALNLAPTHRARFLRLLAQVEQRRGKIGDAVSLAEQAVEAAPDDPWCYDLVAALRLEQGDLPGAAAAAQQAIAKSPEPGEQLRRRAAAIEARVQDAQGRRLAS